MWFRSSSLVIGFPGAAAEALLEAGPEGVGFRSVNALMEDDEEQHGCNYESYVSQVHQR